MQINNKLIKVEDTKFRGFGNNKFADVKNSRALNTTYTNTSDVYKQIIITFDFAQSAIYRQANMYIDGVFAFSEHTDNASRDIRTVYFIVAPGQTYRAVVAGGSGTINIYAWSETS